jgi:hypothetical protein
MSYVLFQGVATARWIFVLGIVNFVCILSLFLTCRCLPMSKLGKNPLKNRFYKAVYKYHCYIWYVLGVSVVVHVFLAIVYLGIPF